MATATLILDTRRADKNNFYPLKIRITHKKQNVSISIGVSIPENAWVLGKNGMEIKRSFPNSNSLNIEIGTALLNIRGKIKALQESGKDVAMTAAQIKNHVLNKSVRKENVTFISYFYKFIDTRSADRTKELYGNTLKKIIKWSNDYVCFEDITVSWLNEFHAHLKKLGNKANTIAIDERNIRAVIKSAIDEELTDIRDPFRKYKIKQQQESETIPLNLEQIKAIRDYNVEFPGIGYARDVFMASFYLIGMNISDLYDLQKGERAKYKRHKTGAFVDIELQPEAVDIIKKHGGKESMFDFREKYANSHVFTIMINRNLKKIGKQIGVPGLIMYHARHTWATMAASLDIEEKTIAKALSHSYRNTTSRYARFDFRKVDEANRMVLDLLK